MTAIGTMPAAARPAAPARNRQRRANGVLAGLLIAVVAVAPLPLGSNRPFFLALWAAVLGFSATIYLLLLLRWGEIPRYRLRRLWPAALAFGGVIGALVLQLLPLGGTVFTTAAGDPVASRTLSIAPGATRLMLLQVLSYGFFFLLLLQVAANRERARAMALALFYVVAAYAVYGLVALALLGDPLLFFEKWAYLGYATGTFVNRNSFATFLAFGLVLGVTFTLREAIKSGGRKGGFRYGLAPIHLACTGLILAALLATGSRMGLFSGLVGAACAALMAAGKRRSAHGRGRWLLFGLLPVVAAVAVLVLYGAGTLDRLGSIENDASVRGDLYAQVLGMIATRPWLGFGGGSFELAFPLYHQLPVSPDLVWDEAHSTYLGLWVELGLLAGTLPLLIVAGFALRALGFYLGRRADWAAPAAAVSVVVVAGLHSLVDFSLEIEANAFLFLAILALGVARTKPDSRTRPADGGR